jgi:hypothetical protein
MRAGIATQPPWVYTGRATTVYRGEIQSAIITLYKHSFNL